MKPLKGLRIVSLALNLPGPAALMRCRALGATCIKIEPLPEQGADPMRSYSPQAYEQMHAGVRTVALNLKTKQGQTKLASELARAHVLLTSFRPSALKRLGLSWPTLHERHPNLWMVSIVGGEGVAAEVAGHDLTYLAEHGLIQGLELPATLYADMTGSLLAVEAILSCALARRTSVKAKQIMVSLASAAAYAALPRQWQLTLTNGTVGGAHAGYQIYACQDGRVAVAALEPHFAKSLCALANLEYTGVTSMLDQRIHRGLTHWFSQQTQAQLNQLAQQQDLPIHTMPPTQDTLQPHPRSD